MIGGLAENMEDDIEKREWENELFRKGKKEN
jgi:hypothetical protein